MMSIALATTVPKMSRGKNAEDRPLRLACTGFVSEQAGSVAAANALLLQALLDVGVEVDFFSKPSFVDPRPLLGGRQGFRFLSCTNDAEDRLRRRLAGKPVLGLLAERHDAASYNRLLLRRIAEEHRTRAYDIALWMGDYARGRIAGLPAVSFAQGAPGTDARSILHRRAEIRRLAGIPRALKWELLARLRLSRLGLPPLHHSDHIIIGSSVSRERLETAYRIPRGKISTLPYPMDLALFSPAASPADDSSAFRVLWLGRIIPRKRLDLFLAGAEIAMRRRPDLELSIVGGIGFIPGYEKLIRSFAFPERLHWTPSVPREAVPELLRGQHVLAQPSDEENFGSSVAEAQACGLPVIVGATNGNADYLCARDLRLEDDRPETFAAALCAMAERAPGGAEVSRGFARETFDLGRIAARLRATLQEVADTGCRR